MFVNDAASSHDRNVPCSGIHDKRDNRECADCLARQRAALVESSRHDNLRSAVDCAPRRFRRWFAIAEDDLHAMITAHGFHCLFDSIHGFRQTGIEAKDAMPAGIGNRRDMAGVYDGLFNVQISRMWFFMTWFFVLQAAGQPRR